jgi:alkaline phosphatase
LQSISVNIFAAAAGPKNIILMISDGFGPASVTFARECAIAQGIDGYADGLPLDSLLVGTVRTYSSSSLVTDSAAGATAYACGVKTYNGEFFI